MLNKAWEYFESLDVRLSKKLAFCSREGFLRPIMILLEFSGHGVPWMAGSVLCLLTTEDLSLKQIYFNLIFALLFDLVCIGLLKGLVRRQRPTYNKQDMFVTVSLDKFSFPSGHATRVAMVTPFLLNHLSLTFAVQIGLVTWAIIVGISRIILGRHHVSDIVAGFCIGYLQSLLIDFMWLSLYYYNYGYNILIQWLQIKH